LLPLGNMVSAVPIVGIAPIMVMWFGFVGVEGGPSSW
jgi:ABC-type nitrate/sulfonate/bicarbonate transport system permease component